MKKNFLILIVILLGTATRASANGVEDDFSNYTQVEWIESVYPAYTVIDDWQPWSHSCGYDFDGIIYNDAPLMLDTDNVVFGFYEGDAKQDNFCFNLVANFPSKGRGTHAVGWNVKNSKTGDQVSLGVRSQVSVRNNGYNEATGKSTITWSTPLGGTYDEEVTLNRTHEIGKICIFGIIRGKNNDPNIEEFSHSRIYSLKFYEYNNVVRDFVPVVRRSDGVAGLYEKKMGKFYSNLGGGSFVTPLTQQYTPIEYIESNAETVIPIDDVQTYSHSCGFVFDGIIWQSSGIRSSFGFWEQWNDNGYMFFGATVNGASTNGGHGIGWKAGDSNATKSHQVNFGERGIMSAINNHDYDGTKSTVTWNTPLGGTYTEEVTLNKTVNYPFAIFGMNRYANQRINYDELSHLRIYNFKLMEYDQPIRDLIPARNNSTGKNGFYDLVTGRFYGAQNGSAFSLSSTTSTGVFITPESEWTTYTTVADLDFTNAEGVVAYYVSAVDGNNVAYTRAGTVPVGTPLLVHKTTTNSTVFVPLAATTPQVPATNYLVAGNGRSVSATTGGKTNYEYSEGTWSAIVSSAVIAAGQAYLSMPAPANGKAITPVFDGLLSYTRSTTADRYGTICLPKGASSSDITGATFYSIAGKRVDGEGLPTSIVLEEVSDIEAGKPYIFHGSGSEMKVVYSGQAVAEAGSENGLVGSFAGCDVAEGMYLLSSNEIVKCGTGCTIGANRAYINMAEVEGYVDGSVAPAKMAVIGLEGTTGINGIAIEGDAVRYNLSGIRIPAGTKGIVIVNGKKIINK